MQQPPRSRLLYSPPLQNSQSPPHVCWVHKEFNSQAEAHLQAISNVAVELGQVMQKDWTLHPLRNAPSQVRTSEGDPGRKQSGGWYVGVCEGRTAGNPSSLFMLRWTLLSRFSVKAFKFITMFKLFQDFFFSLTYPRPLPPTPIYRKTIVLFSSIIIQMVHTVKALWHSY